MSTPHGSPLPNPNGLDGLSAAQLRRLLTEHLTKQKLGLYWEASAIERDAALNANIVLPRLVDDYSHGLKDVATQGTPNQWAWCPSTFKRALLRGCARH